MIKIDGYFCSICKAPVDVRDQGRTQNYTCEHVGAVIDAKMSGTVFGPEATIPDADLPPEHADAFRAQYSDRGFRRQDGVLRYPAQVWMDYMEAFHANPDPGERATRLRGTIAAILARTGLAKWLKKPLPVFVCAACGSPAKTNLAGSLTRSCSHVDDPILAKVTAGIRSRGVAGASAVGVRM